MVILQVFFIMMCLCIYEADSQRIKAKQEGKKQIVLCQQNEVTEVGFEIGRVFNINIDFVFLEVSQVFRQSFWHFTARHLLQLVRKTHSE